MTGRPTSPDDLISAEQPIVFVIIRREPKYKGGGGKCLIHNFDVFGLERCPLQETDYFHEVAPELPGHILARSTPHNRISGEYACSH